MNPIHLELRIEHTWWHVFFFESNERIQAWREMIPAKVKFIVFLVDFLGISTQRHPIFHQCMLEIRGRDPRIVISLKGS